VAEYRVAQVMLILPSQLSSCRADPTKSEDEKSIDLNPWLVKNRITWDIEAELAPKINPKIHDLNFVTLA
jgi:hypothetical protein